MEPTTPTSAPEAAVPKPTKSRETTFKKYGTRSPVMDSLRTFLGLNNNTRLVIKKDGNGEVRRMVGAVVMRKDQDGQDDGYVAMPQLAISIDRRIPRGRLTVFLEGDPEPVTTRDPRGLSSNQVGRIVGHFYASLYRKASVLPMGLDGRKALRWGLIILALFLVGKWALDNGWFGWL